MGKFLSQAQLSRFRQEGFLVLPGFVDTERCLELRRRALELAREHVPPPDRATIFTADGDALHASDEYFLNSGEAIRCFFEKGAFDAEGRLRADAALCLNKLGHAMHDLDPVFGGFSRTPELAALAGDIGMREPLLLQSMYIFKQARIGGEVACHTDHSYLWTEPASVVGFWFAIDDATTENGCMWALPGGHRLPVKARSRLNASRTATVMDVFDETPYPDTGLVALEASRGTLVLLDGALPHRSGPNLSDKPRHAYTIHAIDGIARYLPDNWLQRPGLPLRGFSSD
ncbi:MAG TPA: phytanoyl-CoA dioxygenase family protein [Steroidobacteraceae bacterium]|nr:phytanoyl-CoA dioxygenase family protein [Steroidobacteraceae bacterium]